MRAAFTLSIAALAMAGAAFADTAYVKPSTFTPAPGQTITVEVAFSDDCCEPRHAVRTDTYAVILPDGAQTRLDRIENFATTTMLEHTINQSGTTRITTGERLGRKGEYVLLDGAYHLVNSDDVEPINIPAGTPILTSQTATVSDAYVTAGLPDWGAIRTHVGRLAMEPALHPNAVSVGVPFIGRVSLDGQPISGGNVILTSEAQRLHQEGGVAVPIDGSGVFTVNWDQPGVHVLMVRLQAPAPDGAETDIRSYTTSLTMSVAPQ